MKYDYDIICIGLGPAGMAVSIMGSENGTQGLRHRKEQNRRRVHELRMYSQQGTAPHRKIST